MATFATSLLSCVFFVVVVILVLFCFGFVEGEVKEVWLPLLLTGDCLDDIPAFPVLPPGDWYAKRTTCAGSEEGLSHEIDFEVKTFVKWYRLAKRCVGFHNDLFIKFEEKIMFFYIFTF